MKDLIEALTILLKYGNPDYPTHCEHDVMYVCGIDVGNITDVDIVTLNELGFFVSGEFGTPCLKSYKYGSA